MIAIRGMIRNLTLFWLLLVVLSGMTGAVMLSANYQVRALDQALERMLLGGMQQRSDAGRPDGGAEVEAAA